MNDSGNSQDDKDSDEFRHRVSEETDWRVILRMVSDLAPLSHVAMQALKLIEDPNVTNTQIINVISKDAALAARLLKISNSAMFSRRAKVSTLNQAMLIVGFKTTKSIILAASLRGISRKDAALENMVWQNSVCVALCASHITKILKRHFTDESFTLGLLHDLGKMVMISQIPKQYADVVKMTHFAKTFIEAEQEKFGYTHALLGALVAKKWNFPREIYSVILHHHDNIELPFAHEIVEKTAIIQAADLLSHVIGIGHEPGYPDLHDKMLDAMSKIGITTEGSEQIMVECKNIYDEQIRAGLW